MKISPKLLVIAALGSGCLTPTQVKVVVLSHELACKNGGDLAFDSLAIVASPTASGLSSDDASAISQSCARNGDETNLGSLVLVPKSGDHAEVVVAAGVSVTAANGTVTTATGDDCLAAYQSFLAGNDPTATCGGESCLACVIATRGVGFVTHEKLTLNIELTAQCKGVFCQAGQTCGADGACVSNETHCKRRARHISRSWHPKPRSRHSSPRHPKLRVGWHQARSL